MVTSKGNNGTKKPWTLSDQLFGVVNAIFLVFCLLAVLYPLYFILMASFSEPAAVVSGQLTIYPIGFTIKGYINVFRNESIWIGYRNSMFYTVTGTLFNLVLTMPAAYALSKKKLPFRNGISIYFLITMYFSGGLIPYYLLVRSLNLINSPLTLVILGGVSVFNVIVSRTFFQTSIPEEFYQAAQIDGLSEAGCFFLIALPLATPIIAVMALYYAVGHWNDYFTALLFVSDKKYQPLQLILRGILILNQQAASSLVEQSKTLTKEQLMEKTRQAQLAESMKYSLIYIASAPMLILYPFVQKYFVKGVLIGSLKG